jgi:hypothetical protein
VEKTRRATELGKREGARREKRINGEGEGIRARGRRDGDGREGEGRRGSKEGRRAGWRYLIRCWSKQGNIPVQFGPRGFLDKHC